MQYIVSFLEGVITFISPCLLPMLPIYVSYFLGENTSGSSEGSTKALKNSLGFVLGFTVVFVSLGAFAATLGGLMLQYQTAINIVTGLVVVLLGLNFTGVLKISLLERTLKPDYRPKNLNFFSAFIFGVVFSVGWTPCVGAFLGSALLMASQQGTVAQGVVMLLCYSLGLGIPFVMSALLIDRLKGTFDFIKRNYKAIKVISGLFLVITGILMMTGVMGRFLSLLSF